MIYNIDERVEAFSTMRDENPPFEVLQPHQTHTDNVVVIDDRNMTRDDLQGVDALVTNLKDYGIAVRTADCVPVLMYDGVKEVIAAVHSGWKGTVSKIVQKTVKVMINQFGSKPENIKAVIGPSIGPESFQVGHEVCEMFEKAGFPMNEIMIDRGKREEKTMRGGLHIDLWRANEWLLNSVGVFSIYIYGVCTYENNDKFFSARHEGRKCGRIINGIRIKVIGDSCERL